MVEQAFILTLSVLFLHATTWEGMIFSGVAARLWSLSRFIKKPLYDCPICMVPWHGSVLCFAFGYQWSVQLLLISGGMMVLASAFLNWLTNGK